ncbi:uncharacterized protein LOC128142251 [Harpia harpyja]|uniref:uncharacterized protein LOC128142251 n=1 Tax=Harpia harpyja TaxID=202280 RepID=UPI0022B113AD|nr:uncharacterized protein LOC128142251 [Harpia harpyja]
MSWESCWNLGGDTPPPRDRLDPATVSQLGWKAAGSAWPVVELVLEVTAFQPRAFRPPTGFEGRIFTAGARSCRQELSHPSGTATCPLNDPCCHQRRWKSIRPGCCLPPDPLRQLPMDLVVPSPAPPGVLWAMLLPGPPAATKTASPCGKLQKYGAGSLLSGAALSLWFSGRMEERIGIAPVPEALLESPPMPLALDGGCHEASWLAWCRIFFPSSRVSPGTARQLV